MIDDGAVDGMVVVAMKVGVGVESCSVARLERGISFFVCVVSYRFTFFLLLNSIKRK